MGEGSDFLEQDQGGQPQGGGEYYGGGMAVAAPGPWGLPEQSYDPRYTNMQPQPVQYQRPQPPAEYRGPVQAPTVQMQHRAPPRRRKASKGMQRMYLVQYYEAVLETPLFGDPNDPYANQVQAEVVEFAQRRIDELLGEAPEKSAAGFEPQEVQVLRALAQKMLEPETEEVEQPPALPPTPEHAAQARAPDGEDASEVEEEALGAAQGPAPIQRPPAPPRAAQAPPQPPTAQQRPQAPAPRPPQTQREMPVPPQMGPRVIARPTPAQRQALEAQRQAPPPRPVYQPPPQPVYAPPPMDVQPARRRGKRGQQSAAAAPPAAPGPPPPLRYAMPMGEGMTAISAMKAEAQIQAGGTVLSQTFVKSAAGR